MTAKNSPFRSLFRFVGTASGLVALSFLCLIMVGCGYFGYGSDEPPAEIELPANPVERAAVQGLQTSYKDSTMWQLQNVAIISTTPVAPTRVVLQEHDPKELYCVCIQYEARYKVPWSTSKGGTSPWERTVRNVLVMKTQSDSYLAMKPLNVCAPFCE